MDTSASPSAKVARRRFRLFSLRTLGCFVVGVVAIVTLIGLYFAEEGWRGKRAWESYRRDAEARGVELDFNKFIPPPVPDEQNFAMTPFLAPLFNYNPRRLEPGQNLYSDTNGFEHATKFASDLKINPPSENPRSAVLPGHFPDWTAVAREVSPKSFADGKNPSTGETAQIVLDYLAQFQPVLDEIRTASTRPSVRFNINYTNEDPAAILLPHLAVMKRLSTLFEYQASAQLMAASANSVGHVENADENVHTIFYLSDVLGEEPFIISSLVRGAMIKIGLMPIWEGLARGQWSDTQLRGFQTELQKINFAKEARHCLNGERAAFGVTLFDFMRNHRADIGNVIDPAPVQGNTWGFMPSGWLYLEQLSYHRQQEKFLLPGLNVDTGRIYPEVIRKNFAEFDKRPGLGSALLHHDLLVRMLLPSLQKYYQKVGLIETELNEALIACALERYRLANGKLPETLDQLAPKFIERVPLDVCNGEPYIYRPGSGRDFTLYSVGWNLTDDGGKTVLFPGSTAGANVAEGDWAWPSYNQE
jgi:hypothetical protein